MSDMIMITWGLIITVGALTLYFHGPSYSLQTVRSAPSIISSFGIFVTFLGIAVGLSQFDSSDIEGRVPLMIVGLGVVLWSSLVGILGALSIRLRHHSVQSIQQSRSEAGKAVSVADLNACLITLNANLDRLREESRSDAASLLAST